MKAYKIAAVLGLAVLAQVFASCSNDFDCPPAIVPVASLTPNTTIAEVKARYWDDARNYIDTIHYNLDGEHIIIAGRVISNGESGNIYKNLVIQDETAALAISINSSKLYETYRIGQELVIDLTDMFIGKYNGLQQLGFPEWYEQGNSWEATFMAPELFEAHAQVNGLPMAAAIDTVTVTMPEVNAAISAADIQLWQSQLVRFDNVSWDGGGTEPFSNPDKSTNRYIRDENGNKILVRNSNYASFANETLPKGTGSVVGILSYYGTDWQLLIRDIDDCIGFEPAEEGEGGQGGSDEPDTPATPGVTPAGDGTLESPYNVARALQIINGGQASDEKVYVEGVISAIDKVEPSFGNATYFISDEGSSNSLEVYRGYALGNTKFTSEDQIKVGDKVVVYGTLVLFYSTPEITTGSYIVSLNGKS